MYYDNLFSEKETSEQVRYKYCKEPIIRRNSRISHEGAVDVGVKSHEVERGVETSFASYMLVELNNSRT